MFGFLDDVADVAASTGRAIGNVLEGDLPSRKDTLNIAKGVAEVGLSVWAASEIEDFLDSIADIEEEDCDT